GPRTERRTTTDPAPDGDRAPCAPQSNARPPQQVLTTHVHRCDPSTKTRNDTHVARLPHSRPGSDGGPRPPTDLRFLRRAHGTVRLHRDLRAGTPHRGRRWFPGRRGRTRP